MATDTSNNLHYSFSADIHPDGFPFPDRSGCGHAFMPRAHIKDFPDAKEGKIVKDTRIGIIRCPDGRIVILGGEHFRVEDVPDFKWANFHHWFIDVTERSQTVLRCVTDEPEEIARRPPPKANAAFRPDGAVSRFDTAYEKVAHAFRDKVSSNLADEFDPLTPMNRRLILDNTPTRGYDPALPTFELLSQAMLAGNVHHAATSAMNVRSQSSIEYRTGILQRVRGWQQNLSHSDDKWASIITGLQSIHDELATNVAEDKAFSAEFDRTLAGIPSAGCILGALPNAIISSEDRELATLAAKAIPFTKKCIQDVVYRSPIEQEEAKQTDQLLMELLVAPLAPVNAPQRAERSKISSRLSKKRKLEAQNQDAEEHVELVDATVYPPHPNGKKWQYNRIPLTNQPVVRHLKKVLRIFNTNGAYAGLTKNEDRIRAIEDLVNEMGAGLSQPGQKYGTMVDEESA